MNKNKFAHYGVYDNSNNNCNNFCNLFSWIVKFILKLHYFLISPFLLILTLCACKHISML